MEREQFLEKATAHLRDHYKCHTVILYGSYLSGDFTEESDVDLIGFTDHLETQNKVETFNGKLLDVWVHRTDDMQTAENFLKVHQGAVLLDQKEVAADWLSEIDSMFNEGPRILEPREKQFLKDWLTKMKIRSRKGDMEGRYRFHWLVKESLEIYFEMIGRWYMGPKKSMNWLEEHDPEAHRKYDKLLEGPGDRRKLDAWIDHLQKL